MSRVVRAVLLLLALLLPGVAPAATVEEGVALLHQGKVREALVILRELANDRPADGQIQATLGVALLRSGDYEGAKKALRSALSRLGEDGDLHRILAEIAAQQGEFPEAFSELEKALALNPKDQAAQTLKEKYSKEWKIEEGMTKNFGGNFTVTYEGGGEVLGRETLAILETAYVDLGARFQIWPAQKTEVILYGNRDFSALTNAPDWAGGLYDGKIRVPVGGLDTVNDRLRRILYHEYAHVLVHAIARNRVPHWLNEGLAQWAEEPRGTRATPLLDARLAKGEPPLPFERYATTFARLDAPDARLAYEQSLSLTAFLIERFGEARLLEVLHQLGEGKTFTVAAAELLAPWDGNLDGLLRAWEETLSPKP